MDNAFDRPILRYFALAMLLLGGLFLLAIYWLGRDAGASDQRLSIAFQMAAFLPIMWIIWLQLSDRIQVGHFFTRSIAPFSWKSLLGIFIMILVMSYGIDNLMTYGLSFLFPHYVYDLISEPFLPYSDGPIFIFLTIFLAAIAAPVMEEFVFRGFLLNRLSIKYGLLRALVVSSLLFGFLHVESFVGATIFALAMSLLYLHSRNLALPILIHIANNLVAIGFNHYSFTRDPSQSLYEFRDQIIFFVLAGLIAIPALFYFFNRYWVKSIEGPPYVTNQRIKQEF